MNILVVLPRLELTDQVNYNYHFPLGLSMILAVLKKEKFQPDVINLNAVPGKVFDILNTKLNSKKYDFVMTGGVGISYPSIDSVIFTANKHLTKPKTVLGGPVLTSEPELIFGALRPTFGVIGEGEETIVELLKGFSKKNTLKKIKGIMFWDNEKIIKTEPRPPILNLDSLPFPALEDLGYKDYINNLHPSFNYIHNFQDYPRTYPLLGSRSCPYQCTFCYHDTIYRKRSMNNIKKEIENAIKNYGINNIAIYDECFAIEKTRLAEFCNYMKNLREKSNKPITWTAQLRVEWIDDEILGMMKDSGCFAISYGFESYSSKVLESMKKNIKPQDIDNALKKTIKSKISIQANFIFGDPAETNETAKVTLDYWKEHCRGQVGLGFINPYPNSKIYQHCIRKGVIKDRLDFIKSGMSGLWLNMTDTMSDVEVDKLRKTLLSYSSKYQEYVIPQRITRAGKDIYEIDVDCPYCREHIHYKNFQIKNRLSFGIFTICRHCNMRFYLVSSLQRQAYRYYHITRGPIDYYKRLRRILFSKVLKKQTHEDQ